MTVRFYGIDHKKVLPAIDLIIKDVDGKYDECLVNRFINFVARECSCPGQWNPDNNLNYVGPVLERLKQYMDHKAFIMLNQARTFRLVDRMAQSRALVSEHLMNLMRPCLDSLWDSLDTLIVNRNLAAISSVPTLFVHLSSSKIGYKWLIDKRIEPPLNVGGYTIDDVVSFMAYYLEFCSNYHVQELVERLFEVLIVSSVVRDLPPDHPHVVAIDKATRRLISKGTPSMAMCLINILRNAPKVKIDKEIVLRKYNIRELAYESLVTLCEQPNSSINNLCRFIALSNTEENFKVVLDGLKSRKRLDGIVVYLSNSMYRNEDWDRLFLTFVIYPILSLSSGREISIERERLKEELKLNQDDMDFVEKYRTDRIVTSCLVQIPIVVEQKLQLRSKAGYLFKATIAIILRVLVNFIKCHYASTKHYKNLMQCCADLSFIRKLDAMKVEDKALEFLKSMHSIMNTIENNSEQTKSIILETLKLLRNSHSFYSVVNSTGDRALSHCVNTLEMAFDYTDHDIMNEFAMFWTSTEWFVNLDESHLPRYVELVWKHMYLNAKDTDHRELLGHISHLLMMIDTEIDAFILQIHGIRRHHDIPIAIADILIERSAIIPTIERIIKALVSEDLTEEAMIERALKGYVSYLDRPTLPRTVKEGLDKLAKGLCITVKGECSEDIRGKALLLINDLIRQIIVNYDDPEYILSRLIRTTIMQTLYQVITGSMYTHALYMRAKHRINLIKREVIGKLTDPGIRMVNLIMSTHEGPTDTQGHEARLAEAQAISHFYLSSPENPRQAEDLILTLARAETSQASQSLDPRSVVDDILNYQLKSDGILDCY